MDSKQLNASTQALRDSQLDKEATINPSPVTRLPRIGTRALIKVLTEYEHPWAFTKEELEGNDDDFPQIKVAKDSLKLGTGIVYDESMTKHTCLWDPYNLECPERYTRILQRCHQLGLVERCVYITPRKATEVEILTLHSEEQLNILKATSNCQNTKELERLSSKFDSIFIHPATYDIATLAAGSFIELVDAIMQKKIQNGMALIRPPGHHAMKDEYCGYCFFNNVSLAAHHALQKYHLQRILIVDWDVHHGQGTQQMFYDDNRVLYFSIHRYDYGRFWPRYLNESNFHYIGKGTGKGFNFNVPLNKKGMTNADYMAIFHQVLLPVAYEFQPELILVSAGYDAAKGCPKGEMEVTPTCFAHFTSSLMGLANGKVAMGLEGGYCMESLAESVALTLGSLLGDSCPLIPSLQEPSDSIQESILNVIYTHKPYWGCFKLQGTYSTTAEKSSQGNHHLPHVVFLGTTKRPERYDTRCSNPVENIDSGTSQEDILGIVAIAPTPPTHRVSLVYDKRMLKHKNLLAASHPEVAERISAIYDRHKEFGLLERCIRLKPRFATEKELLLLHTSQHIADIKHTKYMNQEALTKLEDENWGAYLHPDTYEAATLAVGCVLQTVDSVLQRESQAGVAILRPPGHHAEHDEASGFCIFSNVALAAKYAIEIHGLQRILVVDWDIHHGNGTQSMFYDDNRVLYISLHSYHKGDYFPWLLDGDHSNIGCKAGKGYNVNIPWDKEGMGDAEYLAAFHHIILPVAYQYNPELVLISAGFDSARSDPLGDCQISPETYGHMTHLVSSCANGRVILVLEGGYNHAGTSYSMALCTKALLGDPLLPLTPNLVPNTSAIKTLNAVINVHKKYWSCLKFQVDLPEENVLECK